MKLKSLRKIRLTFAVLAIVGALGVITFYKQKLFWVISFPTLIISVLGIILTFKIRWQEIEEGKI